MPNSSSRALSLQPGSRLLVVSACSASKRFSPADQLTEVELDEPKKRKEGEARLARYRLPAAQMYTGDGHKLVREAIEALRGAGFLVSHFILSACYGLLNEADIIVPYNVTFSRKPKSWIKERAQRLNLRSSIVKNARGHDQVIFVLGREYLEAIGLPLPVDCLPLATTYIAPSIARRVGLGLKTVVVGERERRMMRAYSTSAKEKRFKLDVCEALGLRN